MKKKVFILFFLTVTTLISCKRSIDISGKYRKVKGDYRYDLIVFEKAEGEKYTITGYSGKSKKFTTTGELKNREIEMGWMSRLTFKEDFNQFYLHSGKGSVYAKENPGKK